MTRFAVPARLPSRPPTRHADGRPTGPSKGVLCWVPSGGGAGWLRLRNALFRAFSNGLRDTRHRARFTDRWWSAMQPDSSANCTVARRSHAGVAGDGFNRPDTPSIRRFAGDGCPPPRCGWGRRAGARAPGLHGVRRPAPWPASAHRGSAPRSRAGAAPADRACPCAAVPAATSAKAIIVVRIASPLIGAAPAERAPPCPAMLHPLRVAPR